MTGTDIKQLFERLSRLVAAAKLNAGDGDKWEYTFAEGGTHRYIIHGLKSRAAAEDAAFNLLIWAWNAKDYLRRRARTLGKNERVVERAVNDNADLQVCADLANRLKHGQLKNSRSERYPHLGAISMRAPQAALGALTFRAFEVGIRIANPAEVEFLLPVLDCFDEQMGDAFEYAERAIRALEEIRWTIEMA